MIDVEDVLRQVPQFDTFCSVEKLCTLVEGLPSGAQRFTIEVAGTSANGLPIHHVRFGRGAVKALWVAFPHPNEAIGGLTVFSLLTLLSRAVPKLCEVDVEWHIVPCVDPDGAILNEAWSQKPFTLESYMRGFHRQELCDQVECSFPIRHKRLLFDRPTKEAGILKTLLDKIRPDFYYPLHNNPGAGGAWCGLTRDIGQAYYRELRQLLAHNQIPLEVTPPFGEVFAKFGDGIAEIFDTKKYYDCLEGTTSSPEELLQCGACSWEYLAEIKEEALAFVTELPYVKHPSNASVKETTDNMRKLKLRMDADNKFVATEILQEWENVKADLDSGSAFYRKIVRGLISVKDQLHEGLPSWPFKTRDILCNPAYGKNMTESERFNVYLQDRFFVLCHSYEFVRLLKTSTDTPAVKRATERLESVFEEALEGISNNIDLDQLEVIDYGALARVQLGSGLIVLNSLLVDGK